MVAKPEKYINAIKKAKLITIHCEIKKLDEHINKIKNMLNEIEVILN